MPWIKIEHDTPSKPEIIRMARQIGADPVAILGACVRIWCWFDAQSTEGKVKGITEFDVDQIAGLPGIAAAMRSVGWASLRRKCLVLRNFDRHNAETAKRRAQTRERVKRHRERNACNALHALPEQSKSRAEQEQPASADCMHAAGAREDGHACCAAPGASTGPMLGSDVSHLDTHRQTWLARKLVEAKAALVSTEVHRRAMPRAAAALGEIARSGRDPLAALREIERRSLSAGNRGAYVLRALEDEAGHGAGQAAAADGRERVA